MEQYRSSSGPDRQMLRRAVFLAMCFGLAAFALLLARLVHESVRVRAENDQFI